MSCSILVCASFFFFNDTATTEIYTLSYTTLFRSDVKISKDGELAALNNIDIVCEVEGQTAIQTIVAEGDRKSTRLNSSHTVISYAVFCLKKKNKKEQKTKTTNQHILQRLKRTTTT